jgi:hypothetical protein
MAVGVNEHRRAPLLCILADVSRSGKPGAEVSHPGHNVPFKTEFRGVDLVILPPHLGAAAEVRWVACLAARIE